MLLSELVNSYIDNAPVGMMLDQAFVERSLKKAVRYFCGYAKLVAGDFAADQIHDKIDATNGIDAAQDFDLTPSEYAIIRPLFELYVEHENAMQLEASRGLGVDVFGRPVSEIQQDINQRELELPKAAFMEPVETI